MKKSLLIILAGGLFSGAIYAQKAQSSAFDRCMIEEVRKNALTNLSPLIKYEQRQYQWFLTVKKSIESNFHDIAEKKEAALNEAVASLKDAQLNEIQLNNVGAAIKKAKTVEEIVKLCKTVPFGENVQKRALAHCGR